MNNKIIISILGLTLIGNSLFSMDNLNSDQNNIVSLIHDQNVKKGIILNTNQTIIFNSLPELTKESLNANFHIFLTYDIPIQDVIINREEEPVQNISIYDNNNHWLNKVNKNKTTIAGTLAIASLVYYAYKKYQTLKK